MAIETQQISADNVIETSNKVFASPSDLDKLDLLTISQPTDLDAILNQVNGIQNPIQNKGNFDASAGTFPADADSGWLYKISVPGTIDGMELNVGDVIFAVEDVLSTSSSSHWVKIDNSDGTDILRQDIIDTDVTLSSNSNTLIASQKAIKSYVDTTLDNLNTQLMDEINNMNSSQPSYPSVVVSDWINIVDDGVGSSLITLAEAGKGIIRIYIEAWGDIIKGWDFAPDSDSIIFVDDITHIGKRCLVTYFK